MVDPAATVAPSEEQLAKVSRTMIEQGSKSFARAAALMPGEIRDSVYILYAWCRHCDDYIDDQHLGFPLEQGNQKNGLDARVERLRRKTIAACRGVADEAPFQALRCVVRKHHIPERFALDLIDGFAMDAAAQRYRSDEDTLLYCYHVAGAVGVMMAMVMGVRDQSTLLRASDLGIAFQLTNISRDVVADARMGRVYLPENWLAEAGLDAASIADPGKRRLLFRAVTHALEVADGYYASAMQAIPSLPFRCAWSIASAQRIYRAIGAEILRAGPSAWDGRVSTSRRQKLGHVALAGTDAAVAVTALRLRNRGPRENLWTPPSLRDSQFARSVIGIDELARAPA